MPGRRLWTRLRLAASGALALLACPSCSLVNQDLPNEPPVVQVRDVDTTRVARGGKVRLEVNASDEDDDPLSYEWTADGAGTLTDSTSNITSWIAPEQILGSSELFLIRVRIDDHQPDTEDPVESFLIEVVQRAPVLSAPGDTVVSFREPVVVLPARATDEDNDALTFEWEVRDDEGRLAAEDLQLSIATGPDSSTATLRTLAPGWVPMALTVTDGADTLRRTIDVTITEPELPEGGMVPLVLERADGNRLPYEIDVYEYPNRRGQLPLLVDNWFQASALCRAQGKRLCTSVEWLFACQGPEGAVSSSVDDQEDLPLDHYGIRFCNGTGSAYAGDDPAFDAVAPSGSFPNCAASTGVYDLTGNAFEWLSDVHPIDGRQARASLSGTAVLSPCASIDAALPAVPYEDEMADDDEGVVNGLLGQTEYQGYAIPGRGFRCCR